MTGAATGRNYPNSDDVRRMAGKTTAEMRAYVAEQTCPFCDKGPFKSLASHTYRAHGVLADDLRFAAGMTTTDSLSSPEYAARMRGMVDLDTAKRNFAAGQGRRNVPAEGTAEYDRWKRRQWEAHDRRRPGDSNAAHRRALDRLAAAHRAEYEELLQQERQRKMEDPT